MSVSGRSRPKRLLAVDWDPRMLRIVHAVLGKRGPKIERVLSVAIPADVDPDQPQKMGEHIARVLAQEGIQTKHAVVDIPRDQAILNTFSLPCQVPDDLPGIVELQVAKQLPFAVADAVVDYAVAPYGPADATAEVLVAAIRHEVVRQYEATFAAAGLRLDRIGLRPFANKVAACALLRHAMPSRLLFIDVRPTLTEINVVRDSFLAFSRAASVVIPPAADMARAPSLGLVRDGVSISLVESGAAGVDVAEPKGLAGVIQSLVVEVTRSIEAYRAADPAGQMDYAVIGGDLGVEESLAEAVQQRLGITTELYNPAASFGWEPDEGAGASAFGAALGLVLSYGDDDASRFDFLHPKRPVSQAQERLKKAPLVAAVIALFAAAGAVAFAAATKPSRDRLAQMERRIKELKEDSDDNAKFLKIVDDVREFDESQHVWVDVLREVVSNLPSNEDLVLTQLDMDQKEGRVVLKTKAKRRDMALDTIRRLEEFHRDGRERPRFKAQMGVQSEKAGQEYPYTQDLRITILNDENKKGGSTRPSARTTSESGGIGE